MKDKCNYYNTKSFLLWSTLEPIYRLAALFAQGAKADISARGTKGLMSPSSSFHHLNQTTDFDETWH
jgi:hypothetical protein